MNRHFKKMGIWLLMIIVIGCSQSEDQVVEKADEVAKKVFTDEDVVKANYTEDSLSFYLPNYLHVIEQDENNIILESKHGTYIIFINTLEEPTSKLHFETAGNTSSLLYKSYERDDMFGYIRIVQVPEEEEQYELQVGIGGIKITTYTSLKRLVKETEELMKITKSIIEAQ